MINWVKKKYEKVLALQVDSNVCFKIFVLMDGAFFSLAKCKPIL